MPRSDTLKLLAAYLDTRSAAEEACLELLARLRKAESLRSLSGRLGYAPSYLCMIGSGRVPISDSFMKAMLLYGKSVPETDQCPA